MKNAFKFGFLAVAISLSVAACGGSEKQGDASDSTITDSTMTMGDTSAMDTTMVDTAVTDSVK